MVCLYTIYVCVHKYICLPLPSNNGRADYTRLTFGHSTTVNVWERIGEETLHTILHTSWERGRVNLIFSPHLAEDVC